MSLHVPMVVRSVVGRLRDIPGSPGSCWMFRCGGEESDNPLALDGTLLSALTWSVTSVRVGLVRKANHMNKPGRVGALPFQGSTCRS